MKRKICLWALVSAIALGTNFYKGKEKNTMQRITNLSIWLIVLALSTGIFVSAATAQEEPYMLFAEVEDSMTVYAYGDNTYVAVYDSEENLVWEGILNAGEFKPLLTEPGTYKCVGASAEPTFGVAPGEFPSEGSVGGIGGGISEEMFAGTGGGDSLKVICVPWQGNPFLSHDTYDGKQITLKGTIKGVSGVTYQYSWDFGDGQSTPWSTVTNPYIIEAKHTYSGYPVGTSFRAKLKVTGSDGSSAEDEYPITVRANTLDVKVNIAIDEGLWYLHKRMYRWTANYGAGNVDYGAIPSSSTDTSTVAYHSQAMEAFQNQGHLVTGNPDEDPYVEDVQSGLNWILRNITSYDVRTKQWAGYAEDYNNNGVLDDGGNGIGLSASGTYMYTYGIALLALASSRAPDKVAAPVNRPNVDGRTYREIVQDMADFGVLSQNDQYSSRRGGWRYYSNYGDSDNSVTQWPVLGIFASESPPFNAKLPQWAKDETKNYWIPYSQYSNGGFGYTYASYWYNLAKTGAGLILLSWVDIPPTNSRVLNAIAHINNQWNNTWSQWTNIGDFYSMYAVMKGARLTNPQIVLFGTHDWYNEYATWLVNNQEATGRWTDRSWLSGYVGVDLPTAWGILILTPTVFMNPPTAVLEVVPNPTDVDIVITFDGSKSYVHPAAPQGTTITKYEFNFGDGSTYTETKDDAPDGAFDGKTTHTYTQYSADAGYPEGYPATLKVTDSQEPPQVSVPVTVKVKIVPPDHEPTAVIKVVSGAWKSDKPGIDYEGYSGTPVTFDGSDSYDIDEKYGDDIVSYEWDFTSPTTFVPVDATGVSASYTWTIAGDTPQTFDVGLRVTDQGDPSWTPPGPLQGFDFAKILIHPNAPPVADAGDDQTVEQTDAAGTPVTLDGSGSYDPNNDPLTYKWTYNGEEATGVNPTITLPLGKTTITLIVNDGKVDSAPDTVTITVQDTTPPTLNVPASVTKEQTSKAGASVEIPVSAEDICDADVTITSDALDVYPLGETVVTFTATDDSGNSDTEQTIVRIVDTTPPVLTVPADVTVEQETREGTVVSLTATATDICDSNVDIASDAPSIFPLGITVVTFTATDDSGNQSQGNTTVTVVDTTPPNISITGVSGSQDELGANEYWNGSNIVVSFDASDICDADLDILSNLGTVNKTAGTVTIDPYLLVGEVTVTITATDDSGNSNSDYTSFTVVLKVPDGSLILKPESLNVNPGVLTAFVVFPAPYSALTITDAKCDGAPLDNLNFDEDEGKAILKFRRAQMTEIPLDTYFVVRGTFLWNSVQVPFQGSDSIMKVLDK